MGGRGTFFSQFLTLPGPCPCAAPVSRLCWARSSLRGVRGVLSSRFFPWGSLRAVALEFAVLPSECELLVAPGFGYLCGLSPEGPAVLLAACLLARPRSLPVSPLVCAQWPQLSLLLAVPPAVSRLPRAAALTGGSCLACLRRPGAHRLTAASARFAICVDSALVPLTGFSYSAFLIARPGGFSSVGVLLWTTIHISGEC